MSFYNSFRRFAYTKIRRFFLLVIFPRPSYPLLQPMKPTNALLKRKRRKAYIKRKKTIVAARIKNSRKAKK